MNFFNYIIWSPNPEIFPNFDFEMGSFNLGDVRWYGLLFAAGFIVGQQLMYRFFKAEGKPEKDVDSLTLWMIIATIVGARLGHVFFYEPMKYLQDPISIFKTWEGGLASHGAAIGILTGIYLYVHYYVDINPFSWRFVWKKRKRPGQSYLWVFDRIVIGVAIIGTFIRFGNFLNSEIIGIPMRTEQGVVFARDVIDRLEYMPQIDEVNILKDKSREMDEFGYVPVEIEILFSKGVNTAAISSQIVQTNVKTILNNYKYVAMHIYEPAGNQIAFETSQTSRGRQMATIQTMAITRHPAQLYESFSSFLLFLLLLYLWNRKKGQLPEGLLFGVFLIILFGLRFFYEFVKVDQVDFENTMALNMGQILSIPLVLWGAYVLFNLKKLQPKKQE